MKDMEKAKNDRMRANNKCPKCGGTIGLTNDVYGWYEECIQCGHTTYLDVIYDENQQPSLVETSAAG